jgi:excisionase family DNA binding protein
MRTWLSVRQAAEHACVSRDTIYTACERRETRHVRLGGRRAIRVKAEWVDAWLERDTRRPEDRPIADRERPGQRSELTT